MLREESLLEELAPDPLMQLRISFAERCFTNVQDLSRLMDCKAGYLLSAVALLTGALGIVAARALGASPQLAWQEWLRGAGALFFLAYSVTGAVLISRTLTIFRARPDAGVPGSEAPGLIFPLILLKRYHTVGRPESDERTYYKRLRNLSSDDILRDYASQIVEVSCIYDKKQREINQSMRLSIVLAACWVMTMLLFLAIIVGT